MDGEVRVPIRGSADIVLARSKSRELAAEIGFDGGDQTIIATAVSEVARNIVEYAKEGEILLRPVHERGKKGLTVIARDEGPGIADVAKALQVGYSTGKGLGLGLPGARRLVDEFEVASRVGQGTVITMKKWMAVYGQ